MAVDEMKTNPDIQSKKRKRSKRGLKKKSIELSDANHDDAPEEMPSVPTNLEKKRKSKKLKLTVDSSSESVEVVQKESETSLKSVNDEKKKTSEEASAAEAGNSELTIFHENDTLVSQSKKKKKKKKDKKSPANSVSQSAQGNHDSTSNASKPEKSKKKKWKKKKSKQKNESTNSPPKKSSSHNSNPVSSRSEKAISYLETWKNDRNKWKFEKLTQIWLFKNMFDENMVIFQICFIFFPALISFLIFFTFFRYLKQHLKLYWNISSIYKVKVKILLSSYAKVFSKKKKK